MVRLPVLTAGLGLLVGAAVATGVSIQIHGSSAAPTNARPAAVHKALPTMASTSPTITAPKPNSVTATRTVVATKTVVVTAHPVAAPTPATVTPQASATTTKVEGKVRWEFFTGADLLAAEGAAASDGCAASDGAVNIADGNGHILTVHQTRPKRLSVERDSSGDLTVKCAEDYTVTVAREAVYVVTFTNAPTEGTGSCQLSAPMTKATANGGRNVITMPTVGWFFGCT